MKIFFKLFITLSIFFFLTNSAFAQQKAFGQFSNENKKTQKKLLKSARHESDKGNLQASLDKYAELLKIDSTNPTFNLEMAQTLYDNFMQPRSIPYYEKAIKYCKDTLGEAYAYLAAGYHLTGNFEAAKKNYTLYLNMLDVYGNDLTSEENRELKSDIRHKIEMCDNGKKISQTRADKFSLNGKTRPFQIYSLSPNVNSNYDDYGAVLSSNDSLIYFTSKNPGTTGGKLDFDDKYFEDIYVSKAEKNSWTPAENLGAPINTKKHEAVIGLSPDNQTIYFYRGIRQGTFFSSKKTGNTWSKPEILYKESDINTSAWETSVFGFTLAGDELYVVSDREGGKGGRDIYIAKKEKDGTWGELKNLGEPINTEYDEDAPFITADGKTLYFSSTGHNSMGGFDIFKSERNGNKWSEPVNLGVPFNTPGSDIYFIIANTSDRAFYSSNGISSERNDMNIYAIDLCDDIPVITLNGLAMGISNGKISVAEKGSGKEIASTEIMNGKYAVKVEHGKSYKFTLNTNGIEPATAEISVPKMCKVHDVYQEINFTKAGQPLVYKNAFFDIKEAAGSQNYADFIAKANKTSLKDYSEVSVNTNPATIATTTTAATTSTVTASTQTTAATSTVTASTQTTTAGTHTTSTTASTGTITASTHTTSATVSTGTVTASTHTTSTTSTSTSGNTTTTTISMNNILFDFNKSDIKEEFKSELDKAVDFLKNVNKKAKIEVAGHTDSKGSDVYNLALSKRRAEAVAKYLALKGIGRGRIKTIGYGKSKPIASNENPDGSDNPDGRAKNRRTEIVVVQ